MSSYRLTFYFSPATKKSSNKSWKVTVEYYMWVEDRKAISTLFILSHYFLLSAMLVIIRSVYNMIDLLATENISKRTNKHICIFSTQPGILLRKHLYPGNPRHWMLLLPKAGGLTSDDPWGPFQSNPNHSVILYNIQSSKVHSIEHLFGWRKL